jgi:uncharacterized LabA/DUF88 family protein
MARIVDNLTGAVEQHYVFIDGGYLRRRIRESMGKIFEVPEPEFLIDFNLMKRSYNARRAFYYDCLDDQIRPGESDQELRERVARQETFFNKTNLIHGYHVRLGSLTGTRKNLRQKKVDVMLAVDMLTFGLTKTMTVATLVAGDADFIPIVEALVRNGTFTNVIYDPTSVAKELYHGADASRRLNFLELHGWMDAIWKRSNTLPTVDKRQSLPLRDNDCIHAGHIGQQAALFFHRLNEFTIYIDRGHEVEAITHPDRKILERYVNLQYGGATW